MNVGGLGRRYARALLDLARDGGALDATSDELARAATTFEEPRTRAVLLNPAIDSRARANITAQVVTVLGVSKSVGNLVSLLAERDRLPLLPDVARAYAELVDGELGRVRATIRSATPLSAAERAEVVDLVRRLSGRRDVVSTTEVDSTLLGGVVLHVGSKVYDGSLKNQLVRLSKQMATGGA